ncbi:MAG TPA: inositol monophosphatase family protein [Alcanivoracaceae bacterium]|nr:inositol monophosphatase family protein [Alcanivoracaceae bacterium]
MYAPQVNIALRAARRAGTFLRRAAEDARHLTVEQKGHNDFVTQVDRACEAQLIEALQRAYPHHSFLGEECGFIKGQGDDAEWQWIIDPLDGTTNFIHGIPQFAISIALAHKGRIEHGVIYDPMREEEFTASRGRGAAFNGRRIRVTKHNTLQGSLIGTGVPFRPNQMQHLDAYMNMLQDIIQTTSGVRRAGSAALDLAWVAAGRLDGFWETGLASWDIAAGSLLIREAGGLVGDLAGGNNYLDSGNIVAANPKLFKALLQTFQPHLTDALKR